MAFSLNKAQLIGNLGRDSETRFTTNNVQVTSFSVATTHSSKNKDGNWTNETTWHNIVAFSLSDFFQQYLKKGAKVYVEGRIQNRKYQDKEGKDRYVSEIIAEKIIPLDSRFSGNAETGQDDTVNTSQPMPSSSDDSDLPF